MSNINLFPLCETLGKLCIAADVRIGLAESCTGGCLSSIITEVPGASNFFNGCAVVYSNAAKKTLLTVDEKLIETHGAVSEPVAIAMANGALEKFESDIAAAITGIAGPHGGSIEKPVGTVCFALANKKSGTCVAKTLHFTSGRAYIRRCACEFVLKWIIEQLSP